MPEEFVFPTLHVKADSIPRAHYRALKAVWEYGARVRTQYDRKNEKGDFIDPPSRDARVLIEVTDPFRQPRFPPLSFCELGPYIAEIMGVKDHLVVPMSDLVRMIQGGTEDTKWPYTYRQRLFAHPETSGHTFNQMEAAIKAVAKTPYTRRAMATTAVPNLDPLMKEDIPCLREMQLRCFVKADESLVFCPATTWRSRDLYKAWPDNVIALTFLLQTVMQDIQKESGRPTVFGNYTDFSLSLHIYGQDFGAVGGDQAKGLQSFFDTFGDEEDYIKKSFTSEMVTETLIIPQLYDLLSEEKIEQWKFGEAQIELLNKLIVGLEKGYLIA